MIQLTTSEARELLQLHSGRHDDIDHPKWERGFLGSLRPYSGLRVENYHEVMMCLKALAPEIEKATTCDKNMIAAIWGICHLGRAWGVDPGGMLRSNDLITGDDVERLDNWISQISYTMICLLDGCGEQVAFEHYDELEV